MGSITRALDAMNVDQQQATKWSTKAAILRHTNTDGFHGHGKDMYIFHSSSEPQKRYFLLRHEHVILEADTTMMAVLEKSELYKHKLSCTVEGTALLLGDYSARVAQATLLNGKFAGIVLEVEYLPVDDVLAAEPMLTAFCHTLHLGLAGLNGAAKETTDGLKGPDEGPTGPFGGTFVPIKHVYDTFGLSNQHTGKHSTLQYLYLVSALLQVLMTKPKTPR